jgi:hypothetical protein
LEVVPLNRAHLEGAVALHRATRPLCYRGQTGKAVLRAFYDAYANRDFPVGTAALEGGEIVGVMCGATDPTGPARWLRRRRRWRSLCPRLAGGANMALGGWDVAALAQAAGDIERPAFIIAATSAGKAAREVLAALTGAFAAAAASRGATHVVAPSGAPDERLIEAGFERAGARGNGLLVAYVKKL